jgi:glycosyltransferase involved in cell wall biosynthesis
MKILFCFQDNGKSIYLESLICNLKAKNIEIEALFLCDTGYLQQQLEKEGIRCFNTTVKQNGFIVKTLTFTLHIIRFLRQSNYDFIFSHLAYANLYTSITSYFLPKTQVIVCRHNADEFYREGNKRGIFFDKIVNFLSPKILVVSQKAKDHLIEVEKVKPEKVHFLPLAYDFDRYNTISEIEEEVKCKSEGISLRVLFISRLVTIKRIDRFFPVIKHFKENNIKIEMHIIGDGPLENSLKKQVKRLGLENLVTFLGHKKNVIPYIKATDLVVNLSVSESSNQVVKEAGYCGKTVIACRGVGDFDTYLNETNAYLLEKDFGLADLIQIIENTEGVHLKGENLKKQVIERFSFSDKIVTQYLDLFSIN